MTASSSNLDGTTRLHRSLLLSASTLTYVLITLGGLVCVTGSARGCPDWPGCYGQAVPPFRIDAVIEYLHRFVAMLTTPFILAAAYVGWRRARMISLPANHARSLRWISRPPIIAIPFLIAVIIFGMLAITRGISSPVAAVDLGSALIVLALLLTATTVAASRIGNDAISDRLVFRSPFSKLSLWTVAAVFVVTVSSVLVADAGSTSRCLGWPLYGEPSSLATLQDWYKATRHFVAGIASLLIVALVVQAWRTQRHQTATMRATAAVGILFVVEITVGIIIVTVEAAAPLLIIYAATAAALWAGVVVLAVVAGLADAAAAGERATAIRTTASTV